MCYTIASYAPRQQIHNLSNRQTLTALCKQTNKQIYLEIVTISKNERRSRRMLCDEVQTLSSIRGVLAIVQPVYETHLTFFLSLRNMFFSFSEASLAAHQNHHDPACTFRWLSWQLGSICCVPLSGVSPRSELPRDWSFHANLKPNTSRSDTM